MISSGKAIAAPLINDITTTPDDPPQFHAIAALPENQGRDLRYPASFAPIQKKSYPNLMPLKFPEDADKVFAKVEKTAQAQPRWTIVQKDPAKRALEAIAKTRIMRYTDYVVIEVRPESTGCSVHVRSKSRIGKGDLGANAKRIRKFLKALSQAAP